MQIQRDSILMQDNVRTVGLKQETSTLPNQTSTAGNGKSPDNVVQSVDSVKKQLDIMKDTNVQMEYDKDIDRVIIKYVSSDSGEVVSQIPSEKFVEFAKEFTKTIGLLFDKKI